MTRALVIQGLRDEGFAKYAVDYARTHLPRGDFRVHLRLDEEEVSVTIGNREARTSHILRVESNEIDLRPKETRAGASTFMWALNGGALSHAVPSRRGSAWWRARGGWGRWWPISPPSRPPYGRPWSAYSSR